MAYDVVIVNNHPVHSNLKQFICTTVDDINSLPTSTTKGTQETTDDSINEPVAVGSVAYLSDGSAIYNLSADNTWVQQTIVSGVGGASIPYKLVKDETPTEGSIATYRLVQADGDSNVDVEGSEVIDIPETVGKNVEGETYTINDKEVTAAIGSEIFNDYENNKAVGNYSHAEGSKTIASGAFSHAEGSETTASGAFSHAEGYKTTVSQIYSHAEGSNTTASGPYSHAEGDRTTASGVASHAEGSGVIASGPQAAHAEGQNTTAHGPYSHAEGFSTNVASKITSVNDSNDTIKSAWDTTKFNLAKGEGSHTEGGNNLGLGKYSHAEGNETVASGQASHAEGYNTIAMSNYQHVQGKYNAENNNHAFIIGNGESDTARSNAFAIDWNGKIYINNATEGIDLVDLVNRITALEAAAATTE